MKFEDIEIGMKVKIPTQNTLKDNNSDMYSYEAFLNEVQNYPYLLVFGVLDATENQPRTIGVKGPNGEFIKNNAFTPEDIELHEEIDEKAIKPDFVELHNQEIDVRVPIKGKYRGLGTQPELEAQLAGLIGKKPIRGSDFDVDKGHVFDGSTTDPTGEKTNAPHIVESKEADVPPFAFEEPQGLGKVNPEFLLLQERYINGEISETEFLLGIGSVTTEPKQYYTSMEEVNKTQNSKEGLRFNQGKPDYTLMDISAFKPMIEVLEFGAKKYDRDNWKKGGKLFTILSILSSLMRHLIAFMSGEDNDKESGLSHIGHMQCNLMFLGYHMQLHQKAKKGKKGSTFDDRYKHKD